MKPIVSLQDLEQSYIKLQKKQIELAMSNRWVPLYTSETLANIIGHVMGDGSIVFDRRTGGVLRFYGSYEKLNSIKKDLKKLKLEAYRFRKRKGDYELQYNKTVFCRILKIAGAPTGDKVTISFSVPTWIMQGSKEIKKAFLQALFDDELESIYRDRRKPNSWSGMKFKLSKDVNKKKDLEAFLQQIKNIIEEAGIKTSYINFDKQMYTRKDLIRTTSGYFRISTSFESRKAFNKNIGFKREPRKQKILLESIKHAPLRPKAQDSSH